MKKIYLFNIILVTIFVSCQNKQENTSIGSTLPLSTIPSQIKSLDVVLNNTTLGNNFENIDFDKLPRLSMALYDSLKLSMVDELKGYDTTYLSMGRILLENENGKIITVQVITDGEITEHLLSYDKDGKLVDNLIVAYEDVVEYYSQVSSKINSNQIIVQTVNFTYAETDKGSPELSDTIIKKYKITPEFRFVSN